MQVPRFDLPSKVCNKINCPSKNFSKKCVNFTKYQNESVQLKFVVVYLPRDFQLPPSNFILLLVLLLWFSSFLISESVSVAFQIYVCRNIIILTEWPPLGLKVTHNDDCF